MNITTERVFLIFKELNQIPRPSHHEERVADYLCQFAERLNLTYKRDKENCVVISKPATPGYEGAEPVALLNHMDMVCVGMSDPLNTPIDAYIENGWMKARGHLLCWRATRLYTVRWRSLPPPTRRTACREPHS